MMATPAADAVIIGGGLIGLACAASLAREGATAILLDDRRPGASSPAAAGMLAPSVDRARGPAYDFAIAARDQYPDFIDWLRDATGVHVPLNRAGILQLAVSEAGVRGLQRALKRDHDGAAQWLDAHAVRDLEPVLTHALGGVFHPHDGAVDNLALMSALAAYCDAAVGVQRVDAVAIAVDFESSGAAVRGSDGRTYRGRFAVLATGAWTSSVAGLPRAIPVQPLRGQMLAWSGSPLRHVVFGPRGYVVPRPGSPGGGETLAGATSERTGFDPSTTSAAAASLRTAAVEILPPLSDSVAARHWAGLRPMTPDLLPIIGADADQPALLYACGHSRNGILMAPLTGECISALVRGVATPARLEAFTMERFAAQ